MNPSRYPIPADVILTMAVALNQAFEGLTTAALGAKENHPEAVTVALQYIHGRLSVLHETLLVVVGEHEVLHGSERHH